MSQYSFNLLMYFIMAMGVIVIGVMLLFFVEIQKSNTEISQANEKINATQATLNQTKLFIEQQKHDDERQEQVNKLEALGRTNQTRVLINNTNDMLENYIDRYNNTTIKMFKDLLNNTETNKKNIENILNNISEDKSENK